PISIAADRRPSTVDLIDHCSTYSATGVAAPILALTRPDTPSPTAVRPDTLPDTTPRNTAIKRPHRNWNRLSDTARAEVASRYSAGETHNALAKEYVRYDQNPWMSLGEAACGGRTFPRMICRERRLGSMTGVDALAREGTRDAQDSPRQR